jgi:hypothetical protein
MVYDPETDEVVLSTGKRFYAWSGALYPGGDGQLTYGADGGTDAEQFTQAERDEIATELIRRWELWGRGEYTTGHRRVNDERP